MWEVRLKKDFHGRLFPNGRAGDVRRFENWSDVDQLLSQGAGHFEWRKEGDRERDDPKNSDPPGHDDHAAPTPATEAQKPDAGRSKKARRA